MTANLFVYGRFKASDYTTDGPLVGGLVYTYSAGTTTNKTSYSDPMGTISNTNPVVLDANGEADIYLDGLYKIVLTDATGAQLWSRDNIQGSVNILTLITSTSTTSVAIATGSKTFTTDANKGYSAGGFVLITHRADPTKYMFGQVTSYSGTTLVVNVTLIGSSGTFSDWDIGISGPQGVKGDTGSSGSGSGDMLGASNLAVGAGGVANAATSRANLGLGSSSTLDAGTGANQVVQRDSSGNYPTGDGSAITNIGIAGLGGFTGTKNSTTVAYGDGTFKASSTGTTIRSGAMAGGANFETYPWTAGAYRRVTVSVRNLSHTGSTDQPSGWKLLNAAGSIVGGTNYNSTSRDVSVVPETFTAGASAASSFTGPMIKAGTPASGGGNADFEILFCDTNSQTGTYTLAGYIVKGFLDGTNKYFEGKVTAVGGCSGIQILDTGSSRNFSNLSTIEIIGYV